VRRGVLVCLRIARKRALQALRLCGAVNLAMDRIWIVMGMGWGVRRGSGDAGVMLKRARRKTEVRLVVSDHKTPSEAIFWEFRRI
jgi:hypothetical protein